jgi:sulfite reductase (NADPH) flavoprotein alpha-component
VGFSWWRHRQHAQSPDASAVIVAYASQTGTAATIARATAEALSASGRAARLCSLAELDPATLAQANQALFIASTTGEGDPPDDGAAFLRLWARAPQRLDRLGFALLALGDSDYRHFCAFGHELDHLLREAGAVPAADLVEVNRGDAGALRHWQQNLRLFGASGALPDWEPPAYARWRLVARTLLNPDSPGAPMHELRLEPLGVLPQWDAGDVAEVYPGPADDGMAERPPLPHRDYTLATIAEEGAIGLTVRLFRDAAGQSGLGSGWLCERAEVGTEIALRIRRNRHFHAPPAEVPLILIGNGTGISGLRAHLRARPAGTRNWLIFGERDPLLDRPFSDELEGWAASNHLERLDRIFSRGGSAVRYVQHAVTAQDETLRDWIAAGAAIFVCGSVAMGNELDTSLRAAIGPEAVEALIAQRRYRRDIY